jgi:3-dehydroquinate synthase
MSKVIDISINKPITRYSIDIGEGHLTNLPTLLKAKLALKAPLPKVFIVTHLNLNTLYGQRLSKSFSDEGFRVHTECINVGESIKSWMSAEKLLQKMIEFEMNRSSLVIALGGGVVGDLAGFASSVYQRGIRFVQVPTSLLAMVDSSVGGKVAVNLGLVGKNLIGAFHQPSFVLTDLNLLKTLPDSEWKNGLSEVLKCAFIKDDRGAFYNWLIENQEAILAKSNMHIIEQMIYESVRTKAHIVARDELEKNDIRALLNLGHTFGHSLEAASRYRIAHGEAVSIGMSLAAKLSAKIGKTTETVSDQIVELLKAYNMPHCIDRKHNFSPTELIRHFKYDKKAEGQVIRFILPVGAMVGRSEVVQNIEEEALKEVFKESII